eukprot:CFRG0626T1
MSLEPTRELEVWLVRHGETHWNTEKRIQGNLDEPLNEKGLLQANALAQRLSKNKFDEVYSSDLSRAYSTAKACFSQDIIKKDVRLREINFGNFQRRRYASLSEEELSQVTTWLAGPFHQAVPGGESAHDLETRAKSWLSSLPASGRVIAFAHGGIIATILYAITGRPSPLEGGENVESTAQWKFRLGNTGISKLVITEKQTVVLVVNDNAHLENLDL